MASEDQSRRPDLSALRIDDRARAGTNRPGKRAAWFVAVGAVAVLVVGGLVWARGRSVTVEVAVARAAGGTGEPAVLNASGYVTPRRRATVAAKITGRVKEMRVEEGMHVEEGQVLALLDDSEARAVLDASRAERDLAVAAISELEVNLADGERTLKRTQELGRVSVASKQDLDHAQAVVDGLKARIGVAHEQVKAAEARIAVAAQDLENCTVKAPFAGIAVSKDAQAGEIVSPISAGGGFTRTGISTIVDMSSLEIEVDVNESMIAKVTPSQRVEATLDAYPDWRIAAKVRTVIPTADRQKATVKVRIAFDALDPRILPDMGVKVAFLSQDAKPSALGAMNGAILVPRDGLREVDGKEIVFVLSEGKLERRAVKVGSTKGGDVELLAGVVEGERVVVKGPAALRDGEGAAEKK